MMFIDGVRALFAFAAVLPLVDACLCSGDGDLCSQYDQASVVIHVKVLSSTSTTIEGQPSGDTVSGFKTLGAYKGQLDHIYAQPGETFDIATWGDNAPCEVNLVPGKEYLIGLYDTSANALGDGGDGGEKLQSMDLCGLFREWETVTKDEWIILKNGCRDNGGSSGGSSPGTGGAGGGVVAPRRLGNPEHSSRPPHKLPEVPNVPRSNGAHHTPYDPLPPGNFIDPDAPTDNGPTRALSAPGGRGSSPPPPGDKGGKPLPPARSNGGGGGNAPPPSRGTGGGGARFLRGLDVVGVGGGGFGSRGDGGQDELPAPGSGGRGGLPRPGGLHGPRSLGGRGGHGGHPPPPPPKHHPGDYDGNCHMKCANDQVCAYVDPDGGFGCVRPICDATCPLDQECHPLRVFTCVERIDGYWEPPEHRAECKDCEDPLKICVPQIDGGECGGDDHDPHEHHDHGVPCGKGFCDDDDQVCAHVNGGAGHACVYENPNCHDHCEAVSEECREITVDGTGGLDGGRVCAKKCPSECLTEGSSPGECEDLAFVCDSKLCHLPDRKCVPVAS